MYDCIIIGGGPAGMTAGIYLSRKNLNSLLITKDFVGQVGGSSLVENYPGFESIIGIELIKKFKEHLYQNSNTKITKGEGVIKIKKKDNIFIVITIDDNKQEREYKAKTIIVASGAIYKKIGIPGEKEFYGKGVSHCSICDAPLFKDKMAIVVGGGNSGILAVIDLLPYAKKISILEYDSKLRADPVLIDKIKDSKNVFIFLNTELKKIIGEKKVNVVEFFDYKNKKTFLLATHGVFIKVGVKPNTSFLSKNLLNEKNELIINIDCSTEISGLFGAGDVTNIKNKQIVVAAGEGCKAALSVFDFLTNF